MMSGRDVEREIARHQRDLEQMAALAKAEAEYIRKKADCQLRDGFAGKAMQGFLSGMPSFHEGRVEALATDAFNIADAMMAERAKRDANGQA